MQSKAIVDKTVCTGKKIDTQTNRTEKRIQKKIHICGQMIFHNLVKFWQGYRVTETLTHCERECKII